MYITGTIQNVSKVYCYRSVLNQSASQKALIVNNSTSYKTKEHSQGHVHDDQHVLLHSKANVYVPV